MKRCSIVIVSYNQSDHLQRCLISLESQMPGDVEVTIVDNRSSEDIPGLVRDRFPWVRLIESGANLGFAAGCNLGILRSSSEFVLLLNSDVVVKSGFVEEMLAPFDGANRLGAVAAPMVFQRRPEIVASAGIEVYDNGLALDRALGCRLSTLVDRTAIFGPSGGAAAYRRSALNDAGLFPERYFMYLEDVDLAWRLRLRGWDTVLAVNAVVEHASSASAGEGSRFKRKLLARNRVWMMIRCLPRWLLTQSWWRVARYDAMVLASAPLRRDGSSVTGRLAAIEGVCRSLAERRSIQARNLVDRAEIEAWIRPAPSTHEMLRLRSISRDYSDG